MQLYSTIKIPPEIRQENSGLLDDIARICNWNGERRTEEVEKSQSGLACQMQGSKISVASEFRIAGSSSSPMREPRRKMPTPSTMIGPFAVF